MTSVGTVIEPIWKASVVPSESERENGSNRTRTAYSASAIGQTTRPEEARHLDHELLRDGVEAGGEERSQDFGASVARLAEETLLRVAGYAACRKHEAAA